MPAWRLTSLASLSLLLAACASRHPQVNDSPAAPAEAAAIQTAPSYPLADASSVDTAVSLRKDAPLVYVVKPGDTLWGIASRFLRDPWQWPQLWYVNDQIRNPHLIYPGDTLRLLWVNGRPMLGFDGFDGQAEKLSPKVRNLPLEAAIPTIPISEIREFLHHPQLVTDTQLKDAPYIIEFTDEHVLGGSNTGIYVKNLKDGNADWAVVEPGKAYIDPDTKKLLGYEAVPVGEAHLERPGQPATLVLNASEREAVIGDRLLPLEAEDFNANFYPHPPKQPVSGRIISVFDGLDQIPQYQVVALNRGSADGLDAGTVLTIQRAGLAVADPYGSGRVQLPDEVAGNLMVFKTTPNLSFAMVLDASRPVHVLDKVIPPTLLR